MGGHAMFAFNVAPGRKAKGNVAGVVHCHTIEMLSLKTIETPCQIGHTSNRSRIRKKELPWMEVFLPSYHLSFNIGREGIAGCRTI
jgi:hypothetical protein